MLVLQRTFFQRKERPDTIIDLGGNVLRWDPNVHPGAIFSTDNPPRSPGLIDIQINGAYDFDFSVYDGDDDAYRAGLRKVAENIVETGVTSSVLAAAHLLPLRLTGPAGSSRRSS
jgi:N-acetylglucosamine-6-phosphate deacetylase